jgi:hypothetical protein
MSTRKEYTLLDLTPAVKDVQQWFAGCWELDPGTAVKGAVEMLVKEQKASIDDAAHTITQWAIDNGYFDQALEGDVERSIKEMYNVEKELAD